MPYETKCRIRYYRWLSTFKRMLTWLPTISISSGAFTRSTVNSSQLPTAIGSKWSALLHTALSELSSDAGLRRFSQPSRMAVVFIERRGIAAAKNQATGKPSAVQLNWKSQYADRALCISLFSMSASLWFNRAGTVGRSSPLGGRVFNSSSRRISRAP